MTLFSRTIFVYAAHMGVPISSKTKTALEIEFLVPVVVKEMTAPGSIFTSAVQEVQRFIEKDQFPRYAEV